MEIKERDRGRRRWTETDREVYQSTKSEHVPERVRGREKWKETADERKARQAERE